MRLAVIYLMGRKPDRAIQVLRAESSADLPAELRDQRLMIEARAHSDTGRPELALEVIANLQGLEADRLRADVLWKARRWRDAAEQIEKIYADRWSERTALADGERADVLRAAVGYALAEDTIGLDRWRNKYAAKMADGPDRRAFDVVTTPFNMNAPEFGEVARKVSTADTLEASCATSGRSFRKRARRQAARRLVRRRRERPQAHPRAARASRRDGRPERQQVARRLRRRGEGCTASPPRR